MYVRIHGIWFFVPFSRPKCQHKYFMISSSLMLLLLLLLLVSTLFSFCGPFLCHFYHTINKLQWTAIYTKAFRTCTIFFSLYKLFSTVKKIIIAFLFQSRNEPRNQSIYLQVFLFYVDYIFRISANMVSSPGQTVAVYHILLPSVLLQIFF